MKISKFVYILLGIVLLGGLFLVFKPQTVNTPPNSQNTTATSPAQEKNTKTFELVIKNKKLVSGSPTLTATEGDSVIIKITSDFAEEFHLHGYDKSVELEPGKQADLTLTANITGRFTFELENSKTDIGALEVQPK